MSIVIAGADEFGFSGTGLWLNHGGASYSSSTAIPANTWTHAAMVYNGSTVQFYVNGTAAGSSAGSMDAYNLNSFQIANTIVGLLDEVQLYNRR